MKNKIILTVFILVLAGGSGYYIWSNYESFSGGGPGAEGGYAEVSGNHGKPAGAENGTCSLDEKTGLPADNGACGEEKTPAKPVSSAIEPPDFNRPIIIPDNMPADAAKMVTEKINDLVAKLKANPKDTESLLALGIYRKMIKDYKGAAEVWEYVGKINPQNSTSFNNLGDLYGYFLKDKKKAEKNFLTAIKNGPDKLYIYRNLYEFYRYVIKDDAKAKEILRDALKIKPDSKDFQYLLNNY